MKKEKCLILGCSFSLGTYIYNDDWEGKKNKLERNGAKGTREGDVGDGEEKHDFYEKGWYHYVDWLKDYDVTIITTPGQGYATWYQILYFMDEHKSLKKYSKIIIQETYEPRISFIYNKTLDKHVKQDFIFHEEYIHGMTRIIYAPRRIWEKIPANYINVEGSMISLTNGSIQNFFASVNFEYNFDFLPGHINSGFTNQIIKWCMNGIDEFCVKYKITGYAFSMSAPIIDCNQKNIITLNISQLYNKLQKNNVTTGIINYKGDTGHQTLKGNKYLGKLINSNIERVNHG